MALASSTEAPPIEQPSTPPSLKEKIIYFFKNSWEIYPILILATLFRVYGDNKSLYDDDQSSIWNLARDAATHHMLPASSNVSSLGILHGYFTTYFLTIVALFTGNPVWGAVATGLFNVVGVLITYLFIRRYYGRVPGGLAALFYAISTIIVLYNRYIWQPNLEPVVAISLMFALSVGAIERRKGWLIAASIFLGLCYETHESSIYMVLPFLAALLLAGFKSIRWRDIPLSILALLIIFLPYILWLQYSNYVDINTLLTKSGHTPVYSINIFKYIAFFTSPYIHDDYLLLVGAMNGLTQSVNTLPSNPHSALAPTNTLIDVIRVFLQIIHVVAPLMVLGGAIVTFILLVKPHSRAEQMAGRFTKVKHWLREIYNDPIKRGYILLLVWQCVIPILMIRDTTTLYNHYILFLIPGPYILIALFVGKLLPAIPRYFPRWSFQLRTALYAVTVLTILAELIGVTAAISDITHGVYSNGGPGYPNDAPSTRNAIIAADTLAQQNHINHVYIAANQSVLQALEYYANMSSVPTSIYNDVGCVFLPGPQAGPAVVLVAPQSALATAMIKQYTNATLVSQPPRAAAGPYQLYLVNSKPSEVAHPTTNLTYKNSISMDLLDNQTQRLTVGGDAFMITRWQLELSSPSAWRTTYDYSLRADYAGQPPAAVHYHQPDCTTTSIQSGDQLLAAFQMYSAKDPSPPALTVHTIYGVSKPVLFKEGPFTFLTYKIYTAESKALHNPDTGHSTVTLAPNS
ncbi:MAG TPA: glycosyltransferase family 39 protein [Dictyobacter sp.]|nr:glycosyltransferase family 39 protein [Dictyobacter sp.]